MKVLVLGCGGVGVGAAGQFANEKDVEKIICGDADPKRAGQLSEWVKELNPKVETSAVQVDASSQGNVASAAQGVDLIYNATVPECNVPILKACIEEGASYIDLAAFPPIPDVPEDLTIGGLMKLDDQAKAAGITAISEMGAAPGYMDIATHHMVNQLDKATKVRLKWFDRVDTSELATSWWPLGITGEFFGAPYPIVWENGEFKEVDLIRSAENYDFPEPVGNGTVYTATFHPELWLIPNLLPDGKGKSITYVDLMGGMVNGDREMKDVWIEQIRRQTIKPSFDREIKSGDDMIEAFASSFIQPADYKDAYDKGIIKDACCCCSAEVTGEKDGKSVRHTMYAVVTLNEARKRVPFCNQVGYFVALTGTMAAMMIYRGEIEQKGVLTGDMLEQPYEFLKNLEPKGIQLTEKIERDFL